MIRLLPSQQSRLLVGMLVVLLGAAYGLFSAWAAIEYQTKRDPAVALPTPPAIKFWDFGTTVLPWYAVPASVCVKFKWGATITRQGRMWAGVNEVPFYVACAIVGVLIASAPFVLFHFGKSAISRCVLRKR